MHPHFISFCRKHYPTIRNRHDIKRCVVVLACMWSREQERRDVFEILADQARDRYNKIDLIE